MDGAIVVVAAFLETLEHHAITTAEALDRAAHLAHVEFTGNPAVADAYAEFLGRWDAYREDLHAGVAAGAAALAAVRAAFLQVDARLVAALGTGGG